MLLNLNKSQKAAFYFNGVVLREGSHQESNTDEDNSLPPKQTH